MCRWFDSSSGHHVNNQYVIIPTDYSILLQQEVILRNLTIIQSSNHDDITAELSKLAPHGANFTNGTYVYSRELVVPTTLAGFKFITNHVPTLPLVVVVNSDMSMQAIGKVGFECQSTRAYKVAPPLAEHFPNRQIIVVYFDEQTPTKLYQKLQQRQLTITHHKWGYGTSPTEPKIEGAECFEAVCGFPMPDDSKLICYKNTPVASAPQNIIVVDLRDKLITSDRKLLFNVPVSLKRPVLISWQDAVAYIEADRNGAIGDQNSKAEIDCQEQLDRLGGLVIR